MKKFFAFVLALALLVSLAACGSTAPSTGSNPNKMEDTLILYTTATEEQIEAWTAMFLEKYPEINLEVVNGSAGELITRVTGEAAAPNGDVFMAGLLDTDGDVTATCSSTTSLPMKTKSWMATRATTAFITSMPFPRFACASTQNWKPSWN